MPGPAREMHPENRFRAVGCRGVGDRALVDQAPEMVPAVTALSLGLLQRQALQTGSAERFLSHLGGPFPDGCGSLIGRVFTCDGGCFFEGRRKVGRAGSRIGDAHGTNGLWLAKAVSGVITGGHRSVILAGVGKGDEYVDSEGSGLDVDLCHPSLVGRNRRTQSRQ